MPRQGLREFLGWNHFIGKRSESYAASSCKKRYLGLAARKGCILERKSQDPNEMELREMAPDNL